MAFKMELKLKDAKKDDIINAVAEFYGYPEMIPHPDNPEIEIPNTMTKETFCINVLYSFLTQAVLRNESKKLDEEKKVKIKQKEIDLGDIVDTAP